MEQALLPGLFFTFQKVLTFPISSIHTPASPWSPAPLVGSCVTPLCLFSHFPEEYGPSIATVLIKLVQVQKVLKQLLEPSRFQTTVNRCLSSVPWAALLFSVAHTSDPYTADLSPLVGLDTTVRVVQGNELCMLKK